MTIDDDTSARIARLERSHRRFKMLFALLALCLAGTVLGVVECFRERSDLERYGLPTAKLTILDAGGEQLSALGNHQERPYFKYLDHSGTVRMFFALEETGPALTLSDASGRPRLRLAVKEAGGSVEILSEDGRAQWSAP